MVIYYIGSDAPPLAIFWKDWTGALIDYSVGWSFVVKVGASDGSATEFTKSTGITGATGSLDTNPQIPNVTVAWATAGELNTLTAGLHLFQAQATHAGDNAQRFMQLMMDVKSVLT